MPHVVGSILIALGNIGFAVGVSATASVGLAIAVGAAVVIGVGVVLTKVIIGVPGYQDRARRQTTQIKQAVTPHRLLFGERRISGPITFIATRTHDKLNIVITLCAHPCEGWRVLYLNDEPIYPDMLDGNSNVTLGKYKNVLRVFVSLGTEDVNTQPFPELVAENVGWTNAHKQFEHTKIYLRLDANEGGPFTTGMPNISIVMRGFKVNDSRTAETRWTTNPAMCLRHYLFRSVVLSGLGVPTADIVTATTEASANVCDEFVDTKAVEHVVDQANIYAPDETLAGVLPDSDEVAFTGDDDTSIFLKFLTGDKVRLFDVSDTLPTGLATGTDYYVVAKREKRFKIDEIIEISGFNIRVKAFVAPRIQFATSYINALKGTVVNITAVGAGTFTIRKLAEPRYTLDYLIEVNQPPHVILSEMASSMNPIGGGITIVGGKYFLTAAAWTAPTLSFAEDDMVAPLKIATNVSRKDRVNTVTGLYQSPLNFDQPANYPEITNATYITEDNEQVLPAERDFPATSRPAMAQRLAKIVLEDARQAISFQTKFNLRGLRAVPGDNVSITNSRMGWSSKSFRVQKWSLATENIGDAPALVIDMLLKESASGVYDWNSGEETVIDLAQNTNLVDAFFIDPPTSISVTESRTVTTGVRVIPITTVAWLASPHGFVHSYDIEYKLAADSTWTATPGTSALTIDIIDQVPGLYDFRVRARTTIGNLSEWVDHQQEIFALSDKPGDPTGLSVTITEGIAHLTWTQSVDADVILGGKVEIRHDSDTSTGDWANTVGIGSGDVPGSATQANVPLRDGHLLIKFVDSTGNKSVNAASVKVLQDSVHTWATVDTQVEETTFAGVKIQTVVTASKLTLDLDGGDVFSTGSYAFTNTVDLGSVLRVRVTPMITVVTTLINDLIDSRSGNVDDWISWDGVEGSECDARMEMRTTRDDPTGAPTWSSWRLLDANTVKAWGLQYRTLLTSSDDEANIDISTLQVKVEERLAL